MVDEIQKGKTHVQNTFVPQEHWAYPPEDMLITYDFDPDKAMQMLEDLGFTDADGDGYREASEDITCTVTTDLEGTTKDQLIPAGTPLELTLNTTAGNQMRQETTLLFQQNMKDIGVKVNLEYLAANVFFGDGPDGPLFGRRFDLGQFAWLTGVQPPVGLYYCTRDPQRGEQLGRPERDRLVQPGVRSGWQEGRPRRWSEPRRCPSTTRRRDLHGRAAGAAAVRAGEGHGHQSRPGQLHAQPDGQQRDLEHRDLGLRRGVAVAPRLAARHVS